MEKLTRRGMLKQMLGGAAVAALPLPLVLPQEPVRRIWQVGAQLVRPEVGVLAPVHGQPGLFRDTLTGRMVNIRDFREEDRYDTIEIGIEDTPEEVEARLQAIQRELREEFDRTYPGAKKINTLIQDQEAARLPPGKYDVTFDPKQSGWKVLDAKMQPEAEILVAHYFQGTMKLVES